jgi:hypothetical protein
MPGEPGEERCPLGLALERGTRAETSADGGGDAAQGLSSRRATASAVSAWRLATSASSAEGRSVRARCAPRVVAVAAARRPAMAGNSSTSSALVSTQRVYERHGCDSVLAAS